MGFVLVVFGIELACKGHRLDSSQLRNAGERKFRTCKAGLSCGNDDILAR
jgi:hypothetical protein